MPSDSISPFERVDHEGLAQTIADQIEEMIVSGVLREGTRLPPERELALSMGVSRPKLREAIKQLEEEGLITVRHGEGTFVADLIGAAMSPALVRLYSRHEAAFRDYLEFRREQECFAAALAAERATEEDRQTLRETLAELERTQDSDDRTASMEADVRFHQAVVDASHNSLMVHTMRSIYALMRSHVFYNRDFLRAIDGTGQALLDQHRAIAEAILDANPDAAAEAAARHIEYVAESFQIYGLRRRREMVATRRRLLLGLGDSLR
jgi:GntR family transcriptional repressor for pyruvate dehydrogenase complex